MRGDVTVQVHAPAASVGALLTDVTRIGELSPETFEAEWTGGATGPVEGARFRGHVRRNGRGPVYWTDCRVTVCDEPHRFAFGVYAGGRLVNTWAYRLQPVQGGVAVTESYQLADTRATRLYWALAGRWRARTNERGMRQTLERVKAIAEAGDANPSGR